MNKSHGKRQRNITQSTLLVAALIVAALVYAYAGKGAGQNNAQSELPPSPADAGQPTLPLVQPSRTPAARPSPAVDAPADSRPSGFDFFVLALSWSPEYCASSGSGDPQQCSLGKKMGFVLHGLWPQYNKGYPSDCSTVQLTEAVKSQYRGLYPSDQLFDHEWEKHGTCSGLTPAQYLALSQKLKNSMVIPDPYRAPDKPLRVTSAGLKKEFTQVNPGLAESFLAVNCSSSGRYLQELYVCFSLESKFTACSAEIEKDAAKSCQNPDFLMRNVR
jgi:ribonuclease T2